MVCRVASRAYASTYPRRNWQRHRRHNSSGTEAQLARTRRRNSTRHGAQLDESGARAGRARPARGAGRGDGHADVPHRARLLGAVPQGRARRAGRRRAGVAAQERADRRHDPVDGALEGRLGPAPAAARRLGRRSRAGGRAGTPGDADPRPPRRDPRPCRPGPERGDPGVDAGALAVSLPEACRLSDALAGQLRQRLSLDPAADENAARVKDLRAALERLRDQVALEPDAPRPRAQRTWDELAARIKDVTERLQRGGDVGGLLGPLENDTALFERDLIVGGAERRDTRDRAAAAAELREDLLARSAALEQLAARCVEAVDPAPNYAVPDVEALGPVPAAPAELAAYRKRLGRVGDAMNLAHASYAAALAAHDDLVARLDALTLKASAQRLSGERDLAARRGDRPRGAHPAPVPGRCGHGARRRLRRVAHLRRPPARPLRKAPDEVPATRVHRDHRRRLLRRLRHGARAETAPAGLDRRRARRGRHGGLPTGPTCQQPGCTGTIVDGYCDVCGTPAGTPAAAVGRPVQGALDEASAAPGSFRLESAAIGSQRAVGTGATHRVRSSSQRLRSARLGAGLTTIPPIPLVDAAKVVMKNPEVAEDKRNCAKCGSPVGRSKDGRPGPYRGLLPDVRPGVLLHAQAAPRRPGRAAVRGGRLPRPRRPRLDLPRPRQERLRPLGRAQGPAQLRRRRRARRRDRRAALPRPGRAPADRRDLQLRHARGRRLHRDGVRRRPLAQAGAQGAHARQQAARTTRCPSTRPSPTSSRSCPRSSTSTTSASSTATSSPTTSSRSATPSS